MGFFKMAKIIQLVALDFYRTTILKLLLLTILISRPQRVSTSPQSQLIYEYSTSEDPGTIEEDEKLRFTISRGSQGELIGTVECERETTQIVKLSKISQNTQEAL